MWGPGLLWVNFASISGRSREGEECVGAGMVLILWDLRTLIKGAFPPKGQFCTEDVDECLLQPNACQNGGTCTNRNGGYGCVCVNGWSGDDCSENIDDCAFASCTPGSTCIDRVASFSCMCPEGKAGKASGRTELEMRERAGEQSGFLPPSLSSLLGYVLLISICRNMPLKAVLLEM